MESWWEDHLQHLEAQLAPWWLTQIAFTVRRHRATRVLLDLTALDDAAAVDESELPASPDVATRVGGIVPSSW